MAASRSSLSRSLARRHAPGGSGHLADYERVKQAYEKLVLEEPDNLVGITLVRMDLDRARCVLLGLPPPPRLLFAIESEDVL